MKLSILIILNSLHTRVTLLHVLKYWMEIWSMKIYTSKNSGATQTSHGINHQGRSFSESITHKMYTASGALGGIWIQEMGK